jgi:hypothetical protein
MDRTRGDKKRLEWVGSKRMERTGVVWKGPERQETVKIKKYLPSASSRIKQQDAELVGALLDEIEEQGRGDDMPQELLRRSRPNRSPTHHLFEWDDEIAAEGYRLEQARSIIRSIEIVFEEGGDRVRAFPSVQLGGGERNYVSMRKVLSEPELMHQLVEDARKDAESWARRHDALRRVAELSGIFRAIDRTTRPGKSRVTASA